MEVTSNWRSSYEAVASRIEEMCADSAAAQTSVPACPDWTVADVIAHLAGLAQDWCDRRLDRYGTPTWTTAQVDRFAGRPTQDVIVAWRDARRRLASTGEDSVMGDPWMWAFGDAIVHEADLVGALGADRPPLDAVRSGARAGVARWRVHLTESGISSVRVLLTDWREFWCGEPSDDALTLRTDTWELFRLLYGRRSRHQAAVLDWSGDPTPVLDAGLPHPFRWAAHDLVDE